MFVYTLSRKRALRAGIIILAVFIGAAVAIAAVLTSINTGASETRLPIYSVERGDNKISLTFDCAWGNSNTDELLAILAEHNVPATFFVTGEFAEKFPDDIRKIANAGHEIANHSDAHPRLKGMNLHRMIEDTKEAERKIAMVTGKVPTLYRAPYGEYDTNAVTAIEGLGYKFIQWSVDSIDWQEPDPATIVKRVADKTESGSILLFHNDLDNTTKALPEVLTKLKQAGFEFVRTSDLIYRDNYRIDHTGRQIRDIRVILPVSGDDAVINHELNEALSIIASRLTREEINSLIHGISPEITAKLTPHLSTAQLNALMSLTDEERKMAICALICEPEPESGIHHHEHEHTHEETTPHNQYTGEPTDEEHEGAEWWRDLDKHNEEERPPNWWEELDKHEDGQMPDLNELLEIHGAGGSIPDLSELLEDYYDKA